MDHFLLLEDSSIYLLSEDYAEIPTEADALQDSTCCPHDVSSPLFLAIRLIILIKYYQVLTGEVLALLKEKGAELHELPSIYWRVSQVMGLESDGLGV